MNERMLDLLGDWHRGELDDEDYETCDVCSGTGRVVADQFDRIAPLASSSQTTHECWDCDATGLRRVPRRGIDIALDRWRAA